MNETVKTLFGLPILGMPGICSDCGETYYVGPSGCRCQQEKRRAHLKKLEKVHPFDQSYRFYGLGTPPSGHINKPLEEVWAYREEWEKEAELKLLNVQGETK